ncbi:MAG: gamma-glutamylcyclotransferase family protein [Litorimonas sp.]
MEYLFSYGTLRDPAVQRETFGCEVAGEPDALVGYRLEDMSISDPAVVALSGSSVHPVAVPSADPSDRVPGHVFALTPEQLARADAYESADYRRIGVSLASGLAAWLYVKD